MKRKFLEELGLEKDIIDKILDENSADIGVAKGELENVKKERDALKTDIAARDKQLEDLKASSGDNEQLKQQIIDLQNANTNAKKQYEAELKDLRLTSAIKLAIGEQAYDTDLVAGLFDKSKLTIGEDGTVNGLNDQLKGIQKDKAFLFKQKQSAPFVHGGKPVEGSGKLPPADKKPEEMTYDELCAYMEANPGALGA